MRTEKTLTDLLAAESEARKIVEDAQKKVNEIRGKAKKEAEEIVRDAEKRGKEESRKILEEARNQVRSTEEDILKKAENDARHWEELFEKNRARTINFIIESITTGLSK